MSLKRMLAMILAAVMLMGGALAESTEQPAEEAVMTAEEIHGIIEALFAAAAGTTTEAENEARKELTEEEAALRNAANAEYRAKTLPWLMEAIRPEEEIDPTATATPEPTPSPSPTPSPTPQPTETPEPGASAEPTVPVWTVEDSYQAFLENEQGMAYLEMLKPLGGEDMESCMEATKEVCRTWLAQIDHEKLSWINEDYVFWLYEPDSRIDYPVVQGEDNNRYLDRMFNGERNSAGTLFVDYRNLGGFLDPNTLIYGHNMRNNSMFGALTEYTYQAYFEAHPYMLAMNVEEMYLIEIFAGYVTSDEDHCYDIAISDEEDMRVFVDTALKKSDFESGVNVLTTDRLVTLSTCAYVFEDARYIALGRLTEVWKAQQPATEE